MASGAETGGRAGRARLLLVSNGHGEDWIGAALARALAPDIEVEAYPMIGAGSAYEPVCPVVGPRARLASEGWRNVRGSLRRDILTGGLGTVPPALAFLRRIRGRYDRVVVVGDMVGVFACLGTGHRDLFYLDVYKTGAARLYSAPERWAIRTACSTVFCRSENLARTLQYIGVDARYAGNVMMDTIPSGDYAATARRRRPAGATLLPGSRQLTGESFALQIEALRLVPPDLRPDLFLAVAGGMNIEELAHRAGLRRTAHLSAESDDLGMLTDGRIDVHMARGGALANLLAASDMVLSQAGTATVQAIGSGRPAIAFQHRRDRASRFRDEQALFGEARIVVPANPARVAEALTDLLVSPDRRQRLSAIGRDRIGGPGALASIVAAIKAGRETPA